MSKVGIFYASKGGVTAEFAEQIAAKIGGELHNMKDTEVDAIAAYDTVVLMASSYFFGALTEDWGSKVKLLHNIDWSGKNVAIVGVGSQERHADSFCSGAADFYDKLAASGARFIGAVCACGYKYSFSRLQVGAKLRGLCLDKGDGEKNAERIAAWAESIKPFI